MNLIELKNISAYRGNNLALNNINLTLPMGSRHAILGPNGSGKSSLIKLITREIYPVETPNSHIRVLDKSKINIWQLREQVGFVSNDFQINYLTLATGLEVVISAFFGSVGLHGHQSITDEMRVRAKATLHDLNISDLSDRRYINLSTGQQRRLLLARALVHQPQALVFDEPTAGLDLSAKFWFLNKIRALCKQGKTVIIVTHEPSEIVPEIDQVTMLKQGEIFNTGDKHAVLTAAHISELFNTPVDVSENNGYFHVAPK